MIGFHEFNPSLIVETTLVCDRKCAGCYAPNQFSKKSRDELYLTYPKFFIDLKKLRFQLEALSSCRNRFKMISIRGGEPTQHLYLGQILELCSKFSHSTYLETHGKWILKQDDFYTKMLLGFIKITKSVVKVSFDKMHGTTSNELEKMTSILDAGGISWIIAITEFNNDDFKFTRDSCAWINDEKIIVQKKVKNIDELISPEFGVIHVDGSHSLKLNTLSSSELKSHKIESRL